MTTDGVLGQERVLPRKRTLLWLSDLSIVVTHDVKEGNSFFLFFAFFS